MALLAPLLLVLATQQQGLPPSLQWASQPTLAGETILLWGDALGDVTHVNVTVGGGGDVEMVPTFDRSRTSLKAPAPNAAQRLFSRLRGPGGVRVGQRPGDPWWWRGDTNLWCQLCS